MSEPSYFVPEPLDNRRLAQLCGPLDENLRQISTALHVTIFRRGEKFIVTGDNAPRATALLEQFYERAVRPLSVDDIQIGLVEERSHRPQESAADNVSASAGTAPSAHTTTKNKARAEGHVHKKTVLGIPVIALPDEGENGLVLKTRRQDLRGRTPHQISYLRSILASDISFGIGPAGTGKTYLAVACAVDALERDSVQRIILTRPAVEAGERLGFLPGDLNQKIDPYLRPLYDALYDLMGFDKVQKLFEKQILEVAPLAYMRGRTLNNAFIILDEAQNTTPEQMKMFLTRIGFGSKAVVTGDTTQIDLQRHQKSGLIDAMHVLAEVKGIAFCQFDSSDVLRHPLVGRIVDAYAAVPNEQHHHMAQHPSTPPGQKPVTHAAEPAHLDTGITRSRAPRKSAGR